VVLKVTLFSGFSRGSEGVDCRVQKLFSAFPGGWPGLGLLLLRALVGVTLIAQIVAYVGSTKLSVLGWVVAALVLIIASCLLVGFMTPVAAIVIGLGAIALAASNVLDTNQTLLNMIVLTTAIALLGPGAFSIDARMFGRREILIPNTPRYSK
jgi:uncharacterized membrane protein YphA (DoxX/SURF4 family)